MERESGPVSGEVNMAQIRSSSREGRRPTWKELIAGSEPLALPSAHDALTARLIERAGFKAYQVGGFSLAGAQYGVPDINLTHFGEKAPVIQQMIGASSLPVLVEADDGYGDVKYVTRPFGGYEAMGVSAIFIEERVGIPEWAGIEKRFKKE
jgi:2-methylisocitrate lyase-like PEP mutase family enzyme